MKQRRTRLTKRQQQEITRQMLAESRRLTQQGVPLHEVRQGVAEVRDDLVQAACEGITLIIAENQEIACVKVQRIETSEKIEYQIRTKAGVVLSLSSEETYTVLEALYQWRDTLYQDVREAVQELKQEAYVPLETEE